MLLILAASCNQKEVLPEEPQPQPQTQITEEQQPATTVYYIEAKGGETKSSISGTDGSFTWSASDQIAVYAGGYKLSDGLESGGAASATFAFTGDNIVDDASRADFAIFPASLVFDGSSVRTGSATNHSAAGLTVTLPASYTLADVQDEKVPVPMIAANAPGGSLAFKNICALLRVTVNNVPKDTRRIEFDFGGKKVQGEFTLTSVTAGTTATVTSDTDGSDDIITVLTPGFDTFGDLTINLPVPTGVADSQEYTNVVITSYDAASGGHKINSITTAVKSGTTWAPGRTSARKLTAYLPVFTVANDKKVVFAPGNLRAVLAATFVTDKPSYASSWSFAEHQYDAIGDYVSAGKTYSDNSFRAPFVGVVFDLFAWFGESATGFVDDYADDKYKYGIIRPSSSIRAFTGETKNEDILLDWGHNVIGSYPSDTWRTPSPDDWDAAILTREGHCYLRATLTDSGSPVAYGLIITPDQYVHPSGVDAFNNANAADGVCADNTYTLAEWEKLESAGCVFLPFTNNRQKVSSALATGYPGDGAYWTNKAASGSTPKSKAFLFTDTTLGTATTDNSVNCSYTTLYRYIGYAVRLVRDVN